MTIDEATQSQKPIQTIARPSYRDYLRQNGIPLRHDLTTPEGLHTFREASLPGYQSLYDHLPLDKTQKILEIGCHYGAFVYYLNQRGIMPDAIDLDEPKILALQFDEQLKANFMAGDAALWLQERLDTYDFVFMNFVLEHIQPLKVLDFLRTVQKSLRQGGQLWITVPNMENPFNLRLRYMEPTHYAGYTTESLIWNFYMGGFDDIQCADARQYSVKAFEAIESYFKEMTSLMGIRPFHGKYSEALVCHGTKQFDLEDIEFGPYDF